MGREHVHPHRVRYVECDMQGIVFNAHYYTWFDVAHTELLRAAFGTLEEIHALGVDFVVAASSAEFRGSARFDDEIAIGTSVEHLGTTSMTTRFDVRRGDQHLVGGSVRHVCVDATAWTKAPWPDAVREGLAAYLVG